MYKWLRHIVIGLIFISSVNIQMTEAQILQVNSLNDNIVFAGEYILYKGKKINLGPDAFYVDGQLTTKETEKYQYSFNSVNEAVAHLLDGTELNPMTLYIAPWVYWIDDPDDPEIRLPKVQGGIPFGLEIECEWLKFYGLSDNPRDVVLACNRGQTIGAKGNFTMFSIIGNGTSAENLTFGNYCNIDLEYPLNPDLNREKRASAFVQAQLVFTFGDKIFARNTHFVSRLNLCPFTGGKRTLFDHCHFESTDDALAPTGVYLNSTFDIYSSKPFYNTSGTGAVLLNCDINSYSRGNQYWAKSSGQISVIDSRIISDKNVYWGWRETPALNSKYYSFNNHQNDEPVTIGGKHPYATVDLGGKPLLDAYRFVYDGNVIYNIYNLLKGDDDWDPLNLKGVTSEAENKYSKRYSDLPTQLIISTSNDSIETGKNSTSLTAKAYRFGNYDVECPPVKWSVDKKDSLLVKLEVQSDNTCRVTAISNDNETKSVVVNAKSDYGLEGAVVINVSPAMMEAPQFETLPQIELKNGNLFLNYSIDMEFDDWSHITWYRCSDEKGSNPYEVGVSRFNKPYIEYKLFAGDVGWYIMAEIEPKHSRSFSGKPVSVVTESPVVADNLTGDNGILEVNLKNMSTKTQPEVKPGFFTMDCFAPLDTKDYNWEANNDVDPWYYGAGVDAASQYFGLVQAVQGARLRYTPVGEKFDDMKISFTVIPAKSAGQGFSSARQQYMDVFIKFDTFTLNGYALRLIRTTKYGDAIDFVIMKYIDGVATAVSDPVSSDCYRAECEITLEVKGDNFNVHAKNSKPYYIIPDRPEVKQDVDIEARISPSAFGGFGFQHTGTVGGGSTLIKDLKVEWR